MPDPIRFKDKSAAAGIDASDRFAVDGDSGLRNLDYEALYNAIVSGSLVASGIKQAGLQKITEKGSASGYASLDATAKVPDSQIPATVERSANKNVANGYAGLDPSGLLPSVILSYTLSATGAVVTTQKERNERVISVYDFMSVAQRADVKGRIGSIDVSLAVLNALTHAASIGGARVYAEAGRYLISSSVEFPSDVELVGDGDETEFYVTTDIEVFSSDTSTADSLINRSAIRNCFINKTVSGATTKYDIHWQNPNSCEIENVRIRSGHGDSDYSATNVGGIWLDRPHASTVTAFKNHVKNCWMQNNSCYFRNLTDSIIDGGYYWGHVREFAIKFEATGTGKMGACAVQNVAGLICSKEKGGIWLNGGSINQCRFTGIEFDGNPLLDTGTGIFGDASSIANLVSHCTFWGCDFHGVHLIDPIGWSVTGNNFFKGNSADNSYDDVRVESSSLQPNGNTVSGNTHVIDVSRTNKGYAYREVNGGGGNPTANTFSNNSVYGSTGYQADPILTLGSNEIMGNSGSFTFPSQTSKTILQGNTAEGSGGENYCGIVATRNAAVAAGGTMDLSINETTFLGTAGGFAGTLSVTATRNNAPTQSRRTVYAAVGRGSTATFTSLASQDGSGGGSAFTVTMGGDGIIRFTDTSGSGSIINACMNFTGSRSLA